MIITILYHQYYHRHHHHHHHHHHRHHYLFIKASDPEVTALVSDSEVEYIATAASGEDLVALLTRPPIGDYVCYEGDSDEYDDDDSDDKVC